MLFFIHGFNSCAASNTFRLLRAAFPGALALEYPSHGFFADNRALLLRQAQAALTAPVEQGERAAKVPALVVAGSSLGGFYAAQLAAQLARAGEYRVGCVLFNPVVEPASALRPFLGLNTHFYTGERWEFTRAMLDSYALFDDPRPHLANTLLVLGRNDALLDPSLARAYWQGKARIHETDDGHSLAALDRPTRESIVDLLM